MQQELETIKKELDNTRKAVGVIIHLLNKMNTTVGEGFENVNKRLSELEGKNGMQGVNMQLGEIKNEIDKIQKVYPYEDMIKNMGSVRGHA
jgi:hypothetical protein